MLSADDIAAYRRDGFVVARGVLPRRAIDALREEESRLWREAGDSLDHPSVFWRKHETLGRVADRLDPVSALSEHFAAVATDRRMTTLAAELVGAPCIFFKDKLITKPPGAFGYALHHDFAYWSELGVSADEFATLFLAIDPCDSKNGAVELFPGLHRRTLKPDPRDHLDVDPTAVEGRESHTPTLDGGDVLAFHSRIPHRSAPNRSARSRRVYIVTYVHERHRGRVDADDPTRRKVVYRSLARENV
jgi:ectoine hydroxylase-related dioxygenase (phytanoyl-CoA dioxygenase family)